MELETQDTVFDYDKLFGGKIIEENPQPTIIGKTLQSLEAIGIDLNREREMFYQLRRISPKNNGISIENKSSIEIMKLFLNKLGSFTSKEEVRY